MNELESLPPMDEQMRRAKTKPPEVQISECESLMGIIWTDEECFQLNARQHDQSQHPYTCGNDSSHRPLIATRQGWRCADCDFRQSWAHEVERR
jgi:hypothetical protein